MSIACLTCHREFDALIWGVLCEDCAREVTVRRDEKSPPPQIGGKR